MCFLGPGRRLGQTPYRCRREDHPEQLADAAVGLDGVTHGPIEEQAVTIPPSIPNPLYYAPLLEV
jgi:hypothetical protein